MKSHTIFFGGGGFILAIIYGLILCLPFFIDDPALYGSISNTILRSGDWCTLSVDGQAWLDKPHLPFWLSALFSEVTGLSTPMTYRLPLLLAIIGSAIYTYLFARDHHGVKVGCAAVIICLSSLYTVLILGEGRHEPYVMLSLIGSLYHGHRLVEHRQLIDLLALGLLLAFGIMCKGTFVAMLAIGTIGLSQWISSRSLRFLLHWHTPALIVFVGLAIYPEIYALHQQFGDTMIPAKYGSKDVTAIQWFLWESQFGRFFSGRDNQGGGGDITMYLHTVLWACFPWGILVYWAVAKRLQTLCSELRKYELYSIVLVAAFLIVFSFSSFQLPHYIVMIIPVLSIILATSLHGSTAIPPSLAFIHWIYIIGICLAAIFLVGYIHGTAAALATVVIGMLVSSYLIHRSRKIMPKIFTFSTLAGGLIGVVLSTTILPLFADSKGDTKAAMYINEHYHDTPLTVLGHVSSRLDYHLHTVPADKKMYNDLAYHMQQGGTPGLHLITLLDSTQMTVLYRDYHVIASWPHYNSESDWLPVLLNRASKHRRHIALVDNG